jgi:hypothetical protein
MRAWIRRRAIVAGVAVAAASAMTVPTFASPAWAGCCGHPNGVWVDMAGGFGGVFDDNTVEAADTSADNKGVRTWYALANGTGGSINDPDGDGGNVGYTKPASRVTHFHVCVGSVCSAEKYR